MRIQQINLSRLFISGKLLMFMVFFLWMITSCSYEPKEIRYGEEECAHCRMIISDPPFASQMLTNKGRHFAFDAIECMAAFVLEETYEPAAVEKLWAPSFESPDIWLEAETASFLKSRELPSPMGMHFSAYPSKEKAVEYQLEYGGDIYNWDHIMKMVNVEWYDGRY